METIIAETATVYEPLLNRLPRESFITKMVISGWEYPILTASLTENGVLNSFFISRPERLIGELIYKEIIRRARIRSLRGKYAFVRTSSEAFALRKQEEIGREG